MPRKPNLDNRTSSPYLKLYRCWIYMRKRCSNKNHSAYQFYGGRGIRVCEEWSRYEVFKEWALTNEWRAELQIDRIDSDGNYEPSNCRWVTPLENQWNRRSSVERKVPLTEVDVERIQAMASEGTPHREIAAIMGCGKKTIFRVLHKQRGYATR